MNPAPNRQARRDFWLHQTRREQFWAANHPRWQWTRRRPVRRALVLAVPLVLLIYWATCLWMSVGQAPDIIDALISVVALGSLLVLFGLCWLLRSPATRGIFNLSTIDLDERQRAIRARATQFAYPIAAGLPVLAAYALIPVHPGRFLTTGSMGLAILPMMWVMLTLPAAIAAWIEPDERP